MSLVNQLLPEPTESADEIRRGSQARERELGPAKTIGACTARKYNQLNV
jgi:hypothetical protein